MLNDLGLEAEEVPLLIGEMVRTEMGGIYGLHNVAVLPLVHDVIPTAHIISSENLEHQGYGVHFTSKATRILGTRYATSALKLMGIDDPLIKIEDPGYNRLNVSIPDEDIESDEIYNLLGMKLDSVDRLTKGFYIVNGKKVFVR